MSHPHLGHTRQQPSRGLADDLDQLSALDSGRLSLSPHQTSIQMIDEESGGAAEQSTQHVLARQAAAAAGIPSNDGPDPGPTRARQCWKAILAFPSLDVSLPVTFVLSLFTTMMTLLAAPNAFMSLSDPDAYPIRMPSAGAFAMNVILCTFLAALLALATRQLIYQLLSGEVHHGPIVSLYLSTIIFYASIYQCCLLEDVRSFEFLQGSGSKATTNIVSMWMGMIYFSCTTVTWTGYGDIVPNLFIPKLMASSQLIISLFYHISIFSLALESYMRRVDPDPDATPKRRRSSPLPAAISLLSAARDRMRAWRIAHPKLDSLRKFFLKYVFLVSVFLQLVFMLLLHVADPEVFNRSSGHDADGSILFMFFLAQFLQLILIVLMTLALVRGVHKATIRPGFLVQSWLATVSLFAGIYTLIHLLVPRYEAFHLFDDVGNVGGTPPSSNDAEQNGMGRSVAEVVGQMAWFSLVTMTTTGYGDVYPLHLASRLCVCIQMVLGVIYSVVILGQALAATLALIQSVKNQREANEKLFSGTSAEGSGTEQGIGEEDVPIESMEGFQQEDDDAGQYQEQDQGSRIMYDEAGNPVQPYDNYPEQPYEYEAGQQGAPMQSYYPQQYYPPATSAQSAHTTPHFQQSPQSHRVPSSAPPHSHPMQPPSFNTAAAHVQQFAAVGAESASRSYPRSHPHPHRQQPSRGMFDPEPNPDTQSEVGI